MTPSAPSAPSPLKILLLTALLCVIWGSTWIVIQGGLESLPPFGSAAARFTLSALCMTGLAAWLAPREGGTRPRFWLSLFPGCLNFGGSYALVYWSETRLPSGLVSVLWAVYPMFQAVFSHLFLANERLAGGQAFGFALGFLGVGCLFATDLRAIGPGAIPAGVLLLLSPFMAGIGTTVVKRHGSGANSLLLNRNGMFIGAALLWLLALATERDAPFTLGRGAILSVLYLSVVGTVAAFGLYFWLLRHTQANRLSLISYVTPAVALTLGLALADEPVTGFTVAGLVAILGGVFLVNRRGPTAPA